jgi:hypothetical protein
VTDAPLTALAKDDPVSPGDLLAIWNEHSSRWRTCRVRKVVTHRSHNQYGSNSTHAIRTIHTVREIDAEPERGTGTSYAHWGFGVGYDQKNHVQGYHLVDRTDAGRAWVDAQRAVEAQDEIDKAEREEAERVTPSAIAARLTAAAMELEQLAKNARAEAVRLDNQARNLWADAELVRRMS